MKLGCWKREISITHNRPYYINIESGISQWGIPSNETLPAGWEMHLSKKHHIPFYTNFKKKISQWNAPSKDDKNEVPKGWEEMRSSKCNSIYYKNTKTNDVQWIIPDDLSIKPVSIGIPTGFRDIVEDCTQNEKIWKWEEKDHIGTGGSGSAYITCKGEDCEYVVKVQQENEKFYTEIEALLSLKDTNAVPKIFAAWTCKKIGYFVMEKLYPCTHNDNFMWKEVGKKLDIIKDQGYLHFDISRLNVMCKKNGEVVLIDFGLAIKRTKEGDNEGYKTDHAALLTWEELSILQEHSLYEHFNFNSDSLDYTSRTEYEIAKEKVLKNYDVVREKIISAGWIWWQEQEQIRKQKETIENTLQIHLKYQNGLEKDFPSWEKAKSEIISGKKKKCWIWYVFPSFLPVRKTSSMPFLMLKDLDEVKGYIENDILRNRLIEITNIAQKQLNKGIKADILFGSKLDALKFWECITLFFLASMNSNSLDLKNLNEVCDKTLTALHPDAKGQDRLEPNTVNAISIKYFMIVTTKNNHNKRLKELYIKNYSYNTEFSPEYMYQTVMNSNDMWFHLVNNNDMIIGCCSAKIEDNTYIFDDVFIEEKFRGNNYAKLLLLYAMKSVKANNIDASFQITAHDHNIAAVKTYSRIFGEPIRVENNMFIYSGITDHELEMKLANIPLVTFV
jgi:uncharacterized protein (DUF1810 family)/predicted GNAT family N-acyltransferase